MGSPTPNGPPMLGVTNHFMVVVGIDIFPSVFLFNHFLWFGG